MEPTTQMNQLRLLSNQMADAVDQARTALVQVNGRQRQAASGIIYATDLILTAAHVLERQDKLTIQTSDQRILPAQFVGRDPASDLAVLRVSGLQLPAATPAQEPARIGQLILAIGASADGPMASVGIVSTIGGPLHTEQGINIERYIRTDATPYPGFSGGPLIDTQGQVLGILTTGLANGVPLAIPIQIAQSIADDLAKHGTIKRGYLGISSQLIHLPEGQRAGGNGENGLLLVQVDDKSPAHQAGLIIGDILMTLDGHALNDSEDLRMILTGERVGQTIPVDIIRGGVAQTIQITVGQRQ